MNLPEFVSSRLAPFLSLDKVRTCYNLGGFYRELQLLKNWTESPLLVGGMNKYQLRCNALNFRLRPYSLWCVKTVNSALIS